MPGKLKLKTQYIANQYGDIIDRPTMTQLKQLGCDSCHALILKQALDQLLKAEIRTWEKDAKHILTMPETALEYAYYASTWGDGRNTRARVST